MTLLLKNKNRILLLLVVILTSSTLYFYYLYKESRNEQLILYQNQIDFGLDKGLKASLINIDYALESLEKEDRNILISYLRELSFTLNTGEELFFLVSTDGSYIDGFFIHSNFYIYSLTSNIIYNEIDITDVEQRSEIKYELEVLKESIEYLDTYLDREILVDSDSEEVKNHWISLISYLYEEHPNSYIFSSYNNQYDISSK